MDDLLSYIPLFEQGAFHAAESVYVSSGDYVPPMTDVLHAVEDSELPLNDFDWLTWTDEASVFMREPERIATADEETVRRLFTVVRDAHRFNGELLPFLFAKGFMEHLLLRLRELSV